MSSRWSPSAGTTCFEGPIGALTTAEEVSVRSVGPYRLYYQGTDGLLEIVRLFHPRRRTIAQ